MVFPLNCRNIILHNFHLTSLRKNDFNDAEIGDWKKSKYVEIDLSTNQKMIKLRETLSQFLSNVKSKKNMRGKLHSQYNSEHRK
jgi:hypothetical protein